MLRRSLTILALLALAACSLPADPENEPPVDMGNFRLGHAVVVVDNPEIGPFSRKATDEELKAGLEKALHDRFDRYQGDKFYHIGVKLDLYALALPGLPLIASPKSAFVVTITFWDDASQSLLGEAGGKGLSVFEGTSKETFISSGLTRNKARQIEVMSANTAKAIQDYILDHPEWIGLPPKPEPPADGT